MNIQHFASTCVLRTVADNPGKTMGFIQAHVARETPYSIHAVYAALRKAIYKQHIRTEVPEGGLLRKDRVHFITDEGVKVMNQWQASVDLPSFAQETKKHEYDVTPTTATVRSFTNAAMRERYTPPPDTTHIREGALAYRQLPSLINHQEEA